MPERMNRERRRLRLVQQGCVSEQWQPKAMIEIGVALDVACAVGEQKMLFARGARQKPTSNGRHGLRAHRDVAIAGLRLDSLKLVPAIGLASHADLWRGSAQR